MDHPRPVPSVQINGPALRVIRERSGVSCAALARAVLADYSFLAKIERGEKRGIGRETFERIVLVLSITDPRALLADPFGVTRVTALSVERNDQTVLHSVSTTSTAA